jgi:hypothetical protein
VQRPAWVPDRLEYQFACSAAEGAGQKVLTAEEYFHGRVEWYSFDVDRGREHFGDGMPLDAPVGRTRSMVPAPVSFGGMPNTRWWTFEDGRTNFGEVRPDTTDLAKLLLIEFGLVYANDWHIIPCTVPSGAIATVRGVAVTNVFGERTWIEAAGAGDDEDWQRWAMFLLSVKDTQKRPPISACSFRPPRTRSSTVRRSKTSSSRATRWPPASRQAAAKARAASRSIGSWMCAADRPVTITCNLGPWLLQPRCASSCSEASVS